MSSAGLRPGTWYWYRFKVGFAESPAGRTRTAPIAGAMDPLQFAFASCQNYSNGHYAAWRNIAAEDLDLVVHLGDYIYEGPGDPANPRLHEPRYEIRSLSDYRIRHAQYKTDASLRAAHARFPFLVTWDDHEVENNYADEDSDPDVPRDQWLARRAAAYQAYYEHMPLRRSSRPAGPDLGLYRRVDWGALARFDVLDTRQYRSDQPEPCPVALRDPTGYCPEALDESRTMLGGVQLGWLLDGLANSHARWNVLAQQVPFAPNVQRDGDGARQFGADKWDGYVADRRRITELLATGDVANPVVLTGDVHVSHARDVPRTAEDLDAPAVASEFIGTAISSGDADRPRRTTYGGSADNPHHRFTDNHHGYVRCTVAPGLWTTDFRGIESTRDPASPVKTVASFAVEDGRPGATLLP